MIHRCCRRNINNRIITITITITVINIIRRGDDSIPIPIPMSIVSVRAVHSIVGSENTFQKMEL